MKPIFSHPKSQATPMSSDRRPRPFLLALMLTGILVVEVYPNLIENANADPEVAKSTATIAQKKLNSKPNKFARFWSSERGNSYGDRQDIFPSHSQTQESLNNIVLISQISQPEEISDLDKLEQFILKRNSHLLAENTDELPGKIAQAVRQDLQHKTGIPLTQVEVTEAERRTWPNACLGLPKTDEFCAQMLVEGWRVVLSGDRETWIYRTDDRGMVLRMESQTNSTNLPQTLVEAVLQDASARSELADSNLEIVAAEPKTWPNGCLGLGGPGVMCTQALVPGWQVRVTDGEKSLVYRTDESGFQVKLDEAASQIGDASSL